MAFQFVKTKTDNPKDPVSARRLDLRLIKKQLEERGYQVSFLEQVWRHVHGQVIKENKSLFIKLASTHGISRATHNESLWNQHISSLITTKSAFRVAPVIETGRLGNKFFYIAEYVEGTPICSSESGKDLRRLRRHIRTLAESFAEIASLPVRSFLWDGAYRNLKKPGDKLFKRAVWFYKEIDESKEVTPLLEVANGIRTHYRRGLNHGDFAPWHMLEDRKSDLILTDAEWANSQMPKFYDIAYCYQRLCACTGAFEIAAELAKHFRSSLPKSQRAAFDRTFPAILAERTIGGFWDVKKGNNTAPGKLPLHRKLKNIILKRELY